jgi:predicted nucleotidyltransferase
VECYAPYRSTHDIDVVVRERDFSGFKACLSEIGFAHRRTHLAKHTFKGREAGEVDAYTDRIGVVPVDEALFRRARRLPYGETRVSVASLEDLLRLKLTAGREMDLADVAVLLEGRRDEVDSALAETLVGHEILRDAAPRVPELLPEEYGRQARQGLKAWLRERGWLSPRKGKSRRR